jgi:uncharacterized protein
MKTVLITGASEGIGYELSQLFANAHYQLILVARNEQKLNSMSETFTSNGVQCTYFVADLSIMSEVETLANKIDQQKIRIDYLINNAGFGVYGNSTEIDWQKELAMYQLNMISLAYLTKHFSIQMAKNGFGRILNVSSIAGFQPLPFMAGYAASKAFVLSLSQALNEELRKQNVYVSTLCPGVTESKFHSTANTETKLLGTSFFPIATAKEVAQYGYKLLQSGKSVGIYGLFNRIQIGMLRFIPRGVLVKIVGKMMK